VGLCGDEAGRGLHPAGAAAPVELKLSHLQPGSYVFTLHRTGFLANDAYSRYIQLGLPKDLSAGQLREMEQLTADSPELTQMVTVGADGSFTTKIAMRQNDVVLATLARK
jgi:xylan 1,4-beta-xylosidase